MLDTRDIPQANTLPLVGDLVALLDAGVSDKKQLARALNIVPRQVDYYEHAARILGFVQMRRGRPTLTDGAREYLRCRKPSEKAARMADAVRATSVFRLLRERYPDSALSAANIAYLLAERSHLRGATLGRRAQTIIAWQQFASNINPEDLSALAERAALENVADADKYEQREEGSLHKILRDEIANNPEARLGEKLTLVRVEYPFPTTDAADILLIDSRMRFLAVEVEVDVGALDLAGLLQAVKYRHMLAVQFGLDIRSVRAMLVARSIHPILRERADRYDIETREIKGAI